MNKKELESGRYHAEIKSGAHLALSTTLLFALITIFTFIVTINPVLLKEDFLLSFQLTSSIIVLLYLVSTIVILLGELLIKI